MGLKGIEDGAENERMLMGVGSDFDPIPYSLFPIPCSYALRPYQSRPD